MTNSLFYGWPAAEAWMIDTFVATTLLMAAVLIVRGTVASRFGARAAYLLWLAPALRMVTPPLPEHFATLPTQRVQDVVLGVVDTSSPAAASLTATGSDLNLQTVLMIIWLGGALLFFAHHLFAYRRFVRRIMVGAHRVESHEKIGISASPQVASPLAYGIFGKAIIVPHDFGTRFDAAEQRLALAHELTHHRRRDPFVNAAALAMLALHWFNPIAHIAHRAFRLDQESACDAVVLQGACATDRHAYGSALFKAAMGPVPLAACAMAGATTLKARLRRILSQPQPGLMTRAGSAMAVLLVATGVILTASNGIAAKQIPVETIVPRAIVLGGGIIETQTANAANDAALDQAEAALDEAERAADAASDAADAADKATRVKASSDADHARADLARARADLARAQADGARQEADLARAEADQLRRAIPEAPEPPTPPENDEAPAPPSPPATLTMNRMSCPAGSERRLVETSGRAPGKVATKFAIMICTPSKSAMREEIRSSLLSARRTIAAETMLADVERREALASLDREIRALARGNDKTD